MRYRIIRQVWFRLLPVFILAIFCSEGVAMQNTGQWDLSALPRVTPELITKTDRAGDHFFSILGSVSVPREDGSFVVFDLYNVGAFLMGKNGGFIRRIARSGRGPGELNNITSPVPTPEGGLLVYDQKNRKIVRFGPDLSLEEEVIPDPYAGAGLHRVYPAGDGSTFIMQFNTSGWLTDRDKDPELILVRYDPESRQYGTPVRLFREVFARQYINGVLTGGTRVPYSPAQLIGYRPGSSTLLMHLTGSGSIAEIDAQFDTVRTKVVSLPREAYQPEDMESIEGDYQESHVEIIKDQLPDSKVPVEHMKPGPDGEIWLQLNYRSEYRQWLVLDRLGEPQYIVQLPPNSELMHAGEHNLAVQLDQATFALYRRPAPGFR